MRVKLLNSVSHNGTDFLPGQYLTCSDSEGLRLVQMRAAVKENEPEPMPKKEPKQVEEVVSVESLFDDEQEEEEEKESVVKKSKPVNKSKPKRKNRS